RQEEGARLRRRARAEHRRRQPRAGLRGVMRIVDRTTFLSLPAGTVYAKWGSAGELAPPAHDLTHEEVAVKGETVAGVDWVVLDLLAWPEDCHDSEQWSAAMHAAIDGRPT